MHSLARFFAFGALITGAAGLSACGGGGGSASSGSGSVSVNLTDAPIDAASEVNIVFTGIELHQAGGSTIPIDFASPKALDLIKLQNGVTGALTDGSAVPAGDYDWMRLKVLASKNSQGESYIKLLSGQQYPLWIPSGSETGLKLVRPFTVAQGSVTKLVIDFDLRKSITAPPGQDPNYVMRPTLRLLDQLQVGKISATVDLATLATSQLGAGASIATCKGGLYLFAGAAATPDDQDGDATDGADPILYQPLVYDGVNPTVTINLPFVETGSYTLAATCNFDVDVADTNDYNPTAAQGAPGFQTMHWSTAGNVAVTANTTTTISLP
jgi:Domain of unknown function (DUF4382)